MERLTFDGLFCDLCLCQENPCKYKETGCSQRQVWERLKAYEDTGLSLERVRELAEADKAGKIKILPVAMCETVYEVMRMSNREALSTGVPCKMQFGRQTKYAAWNPWAVREKKMQNYMYSHYGKTVFSDRQDAAKIAEMWNAREEEHRRKLHEPKA